MRGTKVGNYELLEPLGEGGMGQVWRARHVLLDSHSAVKLIDPDAAGRNRDVLLDRLLREARATVKLESVHTVRVTGFGKTDDGTFFAVMELLDGVDLAAVVDLSGPLPPARVVAILRMVCSSLEEAHEMHGLVHRDIKPANIMLCRYGLKLDVAKVLDFGLVKAITDPDLLAGPRLTATHTIVGSPAFMAPEVAAVDAQLDRRADLYALGAVAHFLLSGRLLFEHRNALDMMLAHRSERPPSVASVAPSGIPPELDALVARCLEKDPADRFQTAAEVSAALGEVPLDTPWTDEDAERWWGRHHPTSRVDPTPLRAGRREGVAAPPVQDTIVLPELTARPPVRLPWLALAATAAVLSAIVGVWWASGGGAETSSEPAAVADLRADVIPTPPTTHPGSGTSDGPPVADGPAAPEPEPRDNGPATPDSSEGGAVSGAEESAGGGGQVDEKPGTSAGSGRSTDSGPKATAEPAVKRVESGDATTDALEPPATGRCTRSGDVKRLVLRPTGVANPVDVPCGAGIPVGRYTVYMDFGAGLRKGDDVEVEPDTVVHLSCNVVEHRCPAR